MSSANRSCDDGTMHSFAPQRCTPGHRIRFQHAYRRPSDRPVFRRSDQMPITQSTVCCEMAGTIVTSIDSRGYRREAGELLREEAPQPSALLPRPAIHLLSGPKEIRFLAGLAVHRRRLRRPTSAMHRQTASGSRPEQGDRTEQRRAYVPCRRWPSTPRAEISKARQPLLPCCRIEPL